MDDDVRRLELRIYARRVTWGIVFIGGLILVGGLQLSGIDLDDLENKTRTFKPSRHVCLRTDWLETTEGDKDRVQFCVEWIDLGDTSGKTHELVRDDLSIVKDRNGKIHTQLRTKVNYALIGTILFMVVLIMIGKRVQRYFIEKHRIRLGLAATTKE